MAPLTCHLKTKFSTDYISKDIQMKILVQLSPKLILEFI